MPGRPRLALSGIAILLLVYGGVAGCVAGKRLGSVQPSISPGVAGYDCPLFVDLADARGVPVGAVLRWSFGDRRSLTAPEDPETGLHVAHHSWASPGEYRVRAMLSGFGYWESRIKIAPPGQGVDLLQIAGLEADDNLSVGRLLLHKSGQYSLVTDAKVVAQFVGSLSLAQEVTPQVTSLPTRGFEIWFLDTSGDPLGLVEMRNGYYRVPSKGGYVVADDPLPDLLAAAQWRQGWVAEGRLTHRPNPIGDSPLPEVCLSVSTTGPAAGNPLETLDAGDVWGVELGEYWFARDQYEGQVDYFLDLLATAPQANPAVVPSDPEWSDCPVLIAALTLAPEDEPISIGFHPSRDLLWVQLGASQPKTAYTLSPPLMEFLRLVAGS